MVDRNFIDLDNPLESNGSEEGLVSAEILAEVREFCTTWTRAVKTICLYPPSNPLPEEFRVKFFDAVTRFVEDHGDLTLITFDGGFDYGGETVYEATDNEEDLATLFFRDGVRRITFKPDFTREESDRLLLIMTEALGAGLAPVDVANLLWEADLPHVRYYTIDRVMEGAYIEQADAYAIQSVHHRFIEMDSGAHKSAEDEGDSTGQEDDIPYLGAQRERFEHLLNVFGDVSELSDTEKEQIATFCRPDSPEEAEALGLDVLTEILRGDHTQRIAAEAVGVMEKQYEHMVQGDRWDLVEQLLQHWRSTLDGAPEFLRRRLNEAISRAAGRRHLKQLSEYLNANPRLDLDPVKRLLDFFPSSAIVPITAMLGTLEHRRARIMICDYLIAHGRETIDLIGGSIYDKRWYVVRNIAMILGGIGHERALAFLRKSAGHTDSRVRLQTLKAVQKFESSEAERIIRGFLTDPDDEIRRRTLRILGTRNSPSALRELKALIADKFLPERDPQELRELFGAYCRQGGEEAADDLFRMATRFRWFAGRRWRPARVAAVMALGASTVNRAGAHLRTLSRKGNGFVAETARTVLKRTQCGTAALDPIGDDADDEDGI